MVSQVIFFVGRDYLWRFGWEPSEIRPPCNEFLIECSELPVPRTYRPFHEDQCQKCHVNRIQLFTTHPDAPRSNAECCIAGLRDQYFEHASLGSSWDPVDHRKGRCTLSFILGDFTMWPHTWRKSWINCAVLTGNSAGLRTALSSRLSHRELRSSLRESHSFLSLPADTTMASSQSTSVSSNSFSRWASHDIFLFKYHFLLHILRFLFFFFDNIMADVASKQQTTVLFYSSSRIKKLFWD
jgi:hypothetical protein